MGQYLVSSDITVTVKPFEWLACRDVKKQSQTPVWLLLTFVMTKVLEMRPALGKTWFSILKSEKLSFGSDSNQSHSTFDLWGSTYVSDILGARHCKVKESPSNTIWFSAGFNSIIGRPFLPAGDSQCISSPILTFRNKWFLNNRGSLHLGFDSSFTEYFWLQSKIHSKLQSQTNGLFDISLKL